MLAPVLWVLTLLATAVHGAPVRCAALVVAWIVVMGPPPMPDRLDLIVNLVCQAVVIVLGVATVGWPGRRDLTTPAGERLRLAASAE